MIDLHVHSTFSDGSLTPRALAALGRETGLRAMALTDHDSVAGVSAFVAACGDGPMEAIPGVEISAEVDSGTLHVLGYFVDTEDAELASVLARIRDGRTLRNRAILEKLNALGFELSREEVEAFAGEDVVGRPHFAQALVSRGYVADKQAAFDRYLGKGRPAYADRFRLPPRDGIALIANAGGVAVLAHPFTLGLDRAGLRAFVSELKGCGLRGLEVYYPEHTPRMRAEYETLAKSLDLVATGGSDFHGAVNPDIRLGRGFGSLIVPDTVVSALRARRAAAAPGS